jgi:23S rRNA pseudouridine2604 synthase
MQRLQKRIPRRTEFQTKASFTMTDTRRKILGLPARAKGEPLPVNPHRKPIRGTGDRRQHASTEAKTERAATADNAGRTDWRKKSRTERSDDHGNGTRRLSADTPRVARGKSVPKPENPSVGVRISKMMSERGLCSRREADEFIVRGWVYVDGLRVAELGARADPSATITLDAQARNAQQRQVTILLHKPVAYVSGQPEPECQPAIKLIRPENQ